MTLTLSYYADSDFIANNNEKICTFVTFLEFWRHLVTY